MAVVFREWLNANEGRAYPIHDAATMRSTDGQLLPNNLIVDANIFIPSLLGTNLYISSVGISKSLITLTFLATNYNPICTTDTPTFAPAAVVTLTRPVTKYKNYPITPLYPGVGGWISFGSGVETDDELTMLFDDPKATLILDRAVQSYSELPVTSVGKLYSASSLTGIIRLKGVEGVTRTSKVTKIIDEQEVSVIAIGLDVAVNKVSTLQNFAGVCGHRPQVSTCTKKAITSINGVSPDAAGNINIEFDGDEIITDTRDGLLIDYPLGLGQTCNKPPFNSKLDIDGVCETSSTSFESGTSDEGSSENSSFTPDSSLSSISSGYYFENFEDMASEFSVVKGEFEIINTTVDLPFSKNYVLYSEELDRAGVVGPWHTDNQAAITANAALSPISTMTAELIDFTIAGFLLQFINPPGGTYTFSCWLKGTVGEKVRLFSYDGTTNGYLSEVTFTGSWQRESLIIEHVEGQFFHVGLSINLTTELFVSPLPPVMFYAWGAQVNPGTLAQEYLPTTFYVVESGKGLITNYLTYSEKFDQTVWVPIHALVITADAGLSPTAINTADQILFSADDNGIDHQIIIPESGTYTFSCWLKGTVGEHIALYISDGQTLNTSTVDTKLVTFTGSWQREYISLPLIAGNIGRVGIGTFDSSLDNYPDILSELPTTFLAWGAQVNAGEEVLTYIPTEAFPVTSTGQSTTEKRMVSVPGIIGDETYAIDFNRLVSIYNVGESFSISAIVHPRDNSEGHLIFGYKSNTNFFFAGLSLLGALDPDPGFPSGRFFIGRRAAVSGPTWAAALGKGYNFLAGCLYTPPIELDAVDYFIDVTVTNIDGFLANIDMNISWADINKEIQSINHSINTPFNMNGYLGFGCVDAGADAVTEFDNLTLNTPTMGV